MKQITTILDEELIKKIDEIASIINQSRNFVIREALIIYVNNYIRSKKEEVNAMDKTSLQ